MKDRSGNQKIDAQTGRVQPDRRWFGNTRTLSAEEIDKFRDEVTRKANDPFAVLLRRKKLPMGLLHDASKVILSTGTLRGLKLT